MQNVRMKLCQIEVQIEVRLTHKTGSKILAYYVNRIVNQILKPNKQSYTLNDHDQNVRFFRKYIVYEKIVDVNVLQGSTLRQPPDLLPHSIVGSQYHLP